MKLEDYPKFTIIMRGYTYEQAEAILLAMEGMEDKFAVEMTLNTPNAIEHIEKLNNKFGKRIYIGAGTVRTLKDAEEAIKAGAKFLLGPHVFTASMLELAKRKGVISVPAAMTPSEVNEMFSLGADIVKIFPASVVTPRFFKDIQAPLGQLPLMGVGGISSLNSQEFFANGASYLGMGSGIFNVEDIQNLEIKNLKQSLQNVLAAV
ncbi:bifunctional 4-hydroxy-2-oxoglutarate aldolase/2-dehydro-3-deoxy-phosphogluconate aldolase [Vagococcus sp.]|uniref:bifunctional 4-hydroxy-2-oxoglutarate aldolase/2-dehydro-3-deoxy-phosphogluconate aldolase n=1 Tax=Vagococcus sp. TaxID=1933889 RepID=UPI003F9D54E1